MYEYPAQCIETLYNVIMSDNLYIKIFKSLKTSKMLHIDRR